MNKALGVIIVEGAENRMRAITLDRLRFYMGKNGIPVRGRNHATGTVNPLEEPGVDYFRSMAMGIMREEIILMNGSWYGDEALALSEGRMGGMAIDAARKRMLMRTALTANSIVIRCMNRRSETSLDNWHDMMSYAPLPKVDYFPQDQSTMLLADMIQQSLPKKNVGPGGGAWRPGEVVLMVGDRPNTQKNGSLKHRLPFISFYNTGCSMWLAQQLEEMEVPEEKLYWINGYDCNGVKTDSKFIEELQPKGVIAFGEKAGGWCKDAKLKFVTVRHPSSQMLHHAKEAYRLKDALSDALS